MLYCASHSRYVHVSLFAIKILRAILVIHETEIGEMHLTIGLEFQYAALLFSCSLSRCASTPTNPGLTC